MNDDPNIHSKSLKPSPIASDIVDRCIECGFCESNCPSRDAALTPRQRDPLVEAIADVVEEVARGFDGDGSESRGRRKAALETD